MEQRCGVQQLDRERDPHRRLPLGPQKLPCQKRQARAQAFAPCAYQILADSPDKLDGRVKLAGEAGFEIA